MCLSSNIIPEEVANLEDAAQIKNGTTQIHKYLETTSQVCSYETQKVRVCYAPQLLREQMIEFSRTTATFKSASSKS